MVKEITIIYHHLGKVEEFTGTVEHLSTQVFSTTLANGHIRNREIPQRPESAESLVEALNDSAYECGIIGDWYGWKQA